MKISYNWLKQFLQVNWETNKTSELLTDLGLEVEGVETIESIKGSLEGIVIGEVLTCVQHPNADRLKITTVDLGLEIPVQIICGAPNVASGQKVPVATIGTTLYDDKGTAFKIKKGKIRGEESHGMICAEDELGLGTSHEGIMVLDKKLKPGTPAAEVFDIEIDHVFEIGLTPNRADAMSHYGVARDLKAGMTLKGKNIELITDKKGKTDLPINAFNSHLILDNLLSNAIKYSYQNGKIEVLITGDSNSITCIIKDHGIGIKEADLQNIYTPFFRSDALSHKEIKGAGLGLSIVKKAIAISNGKIHISSKYGEGTTIEVTFNKS